MKKRLNHQSLAALCWITFLMLGLTVLPVRAEFCGSDNFSSGSSKWTAVENNGHANLKVTNGHFEYTATGAGTVRDVVFDRWNVNQGSYTNDWAVQVDVHLDAFAGLTSDQSINLDLVIQEGTNLKHLYDVAISRPEPAFYTGLYTDSDATYSDGIPNSATNAALRISFDSTAKTLTAWYDTDGAATGGTNYWIAIETINIPDDWSMTAASRFNVGLAVGSGANSSASGSASDIAVTSGQANFDNFVATSSACSTNSTPPNGGNITSPTFSGAQGLYDVTGVITNITQNIYDGYPGDTGYFNQSISFVQSASGALTGSGTATFAMVDDGNASSHQGPYTAKGSVKSSGANVVMSLAVSGRANETESLMCLITVDPATGTMSSHTTGTFSAPGSRTVKILNTLFPVQSAPLPFDWSLSLTDLATIGTKVSGTATVNLGNNRSFPFTVKGSYSTKTDISKLTLTGTVTNGTDCTDSGKGATLSVTLTNKATITGITGSLLGQKINLNRL